MYYRRNRMTRIRITLKDGTIFEYEVNYFYGLDLDDHLRKGEQFLQTKNGIIRIESIYHITWEDVDEKTECTTQKKDTSM